MMIIWILCIAVCISGILAIWFGYQQPLSGFYVFKPLTMILIILIPILGENGYTIYKALIIGGLLFSLAGDVFLMVPGDRFLEGLGAFLVAHLFYIAAFLIDQGPIIWWTAAWMAGLAILAVFYLKNDFGDLKIPATAYLIAISVMVWLAWSRWMGGMGTPQLLALCGAVLFMISDLILAINRFKVRLKSARALDLFTYYAGQLLIALSVIGVDGMG